MTTTTPNENTQQIQRPALPVRRVVAVAFIIAALTGGVGAWFAQTPPEAHSATYAPSMTQNTSEPETEQPAPTHVAGMDGWQSTGEAESNCTRGTVEPLYEHRQIRGWSCTVTLGVGQ